MLSVQKHKERLRRGEVFPPFLYVSIINSCNLRCQGCWVDVAAKQEIIQPAAFHKLIREAQAMGNVFFGIVGGEPFMHPHLLDMLAEHPGCYFQVFTNGQFITDEKARRMRRLGNVTPLISVEGNEIVSDERRGRPGVFGKTMQGIQNCRCLHQPVPDELQRLVDGRMGRPADRDGRHVHLVPCLPADGARRHAGAMPDARAAASGPPVRGRDAREEADHNYRRLLRRRRPCPVPRSHRHQPPYQSLGRHRAVPDRAVHERIDPRDAGRWPVVTR